LKRSAVYNSAIPDATRKSVNRAAYPLPFLLAQVFLLISLTPINAHAADWNNAEQQLARKIVAVTGPGAVAMTVDNRSSLSKRDADIVRDGLRSALESLGLRFVKPEQSAATLNISLSENASSYVWVAQIRQSAGEAAVAMVSVPRPPGTARAQESAPLTVRKTLLWSQEQPILDVAVLEESAAPTHIAVLDADKVSLYRMQSGTWQLEQALVIAHTRPWPRDLRGRLIPAKDHLLDVYLPGVNCVSAGTPLNLNCRDSDDPWPLVSASTPPVGASITQLKAFFAPGRNFFTGAVTPGIGKFTSVSKFYSAAALPREKYTLWLFAGVDGQVHLVDGLNDQSARLAWGSDLVAVKTACGAGWQILATGPGSDEGDTIRAYELPDREPAAVSGPVEFSGAITALWSEGRGDTAVAVARSEAGGYEAFRLAITCGQ